jgi:hypothetical protein
MAVLPLPEDRRCPSLVSVDSPRVSTKIKLYDTPMKMFSTGHRGKFRDASARHALDSVALRAVRVSYSSLEPWPNAVEMPLTRPL